MVIMLIGVLGTLTLVEGSLSSTSQTTAREQGTNLARDLVERTREAAYADVTMADAPAKLRAKLPASDAATPLTGADMTFNVRRRGVTYTVKVFACSIDDPTDGAGQGDATFCAASTGPVVPGTPPPGPAAPVNVLGVDILGLGISAGGTLLQTVCNALGNPSVFQQLSNLVSAVAPISVCPAGSGGTVAFDRQPDDLRRVRIGVSWTPRGGQLQQLSQTTLLTNPRQT